MLGGDDLILGAEMVLDSMYREGRCGAYTDAGSNAIPKTYIQGFQACTPGFWDPLKGP